MHIRNVLTKAELETLLVTPDLYELVSKGKVGGSVWESVNLIFFYHLLLEHNKYHFSHRFVLGVTK